MQARAYQDFALDSSGIPTHDAKRRGAGWLPGQADIGWSNRIGWYEGFHLLTSITPTGVITGFGFAPTSGNDHRLAETFFAVRHQPSPRLPSVGTPARGVYIADKGFAGDQLHRQWQEQYGAEVVSPPHQRSKVRWSKPWRRWLAGARLLRPPMTSCSTSFVLLVSGLMPSMAFKPAWQRRWHCIIFASGSTSSLGVSPSLLLSYLTAKSVMLIHTKRLSKLQDDMRELRRQLSEKYEEIKEAKVFANEAEEFTTEVHQQELRLEAIQLFRTENQNAEVCPICSQTLETPLPSVTAINRTLDHLKSNLASTSRERSRLRTHINHLEDEYSNINPSPPPRKPLRSSGKRK